MSSLCFMCEHDIDEEEEDFAECDNCNVLFHLKCANITKKEVNARKNSKCLKLYCTDCFDKINNSTPEKLKEILALLYKMDCCLQEQKTSNLSSTIELKLNTLDKKIEKFNSSNNDSNVNQFNSKTAYANIVKSGTVKPAIVIKPKTKQSCTKTFEEISEKIGKNDLKVCGTRNARDGGIILCCENSTETLKAKQIVNEKLGTSYDVLLPKINSPRIRITNIAPDIPNEQIVTELKKHNDQIINMDMRLVTVIPRKIRSIQTNEAVLEVDCESFNKLLELSILSLPWRECKVFEHLHVKRCYKCCGFFHKSTECSQSQNCSRCAGNHKHSDCKSKNLCCVNCKIANEKFKLNLDTKHHSWSTQCTIYQRRLSSVKNRIEYNSTI